MDNSNKTETGKPMKGAASAASSVAADLRQAVSSKYDETVSEVKSQANDRKDGVADEAKNVATALRKAADDMRSGSAQERTLGQVASGIADASDALRDKDMGEILQSVTRVARNNPVLFMSGAMLLGFAASRYAKASSDHADRTSAPVPRDPITTAPATTPTAQSTSAQMKPQGEGTTPPTPGL